MQQSLMTVPMGSVVEASMSSFGTGTITTPDSTPAPDSTSPDVKEMESLIFYSKLGRYQPLADTDPAFELLLAQSAASLTPSDENAVIDAGADTHHRGSRSPAGGRASGTVRQSGSRLSGTGSRLGGRSPTRDSRHSSGQGSHGRRVVRSRGPSPISGGSQLRVGSTVLNITRPGVKRSSSQVKDDDDDDDDEGFTISVPQPLKMSEIERQMGELRVEEQQPADDEGDNMVISLAVPQFPGTAVAAGGGGITIAVSPAGTEPGLPDTAAAPEPEQTEEEREKEQTTAIAAMIAELLAKRLEARTKAVAAADGKPMLGLQALQGLDNWHKEALARIQARKNKKPTILGFSKNKSHFTFLQKNIDNLAAELPPSLQEQITEEALPILTNVLQAYERSLGKTNSLTNQAKQSLEALHQKCRNYSDL